MKLHVLLAVKAGVAPPEQLPPGSVSRLFDRYAEGFNAHLRDRLQYRVPDQIAQRVVQLGISRPDVLDIGCGTGLCGEALLRIAKTLHGVDASPEMIARAARASFTTNSTSATWSTSCESTPARMT